MPGSANQHEGANCSIDRAVRRAGEGESGREGKHSKVWFDWKSPSKRFLASVFLFYTERFLFASEAVWWTSARVRELIQQSAEADTVMSKTDTTSGASISSRQSIVARQLING